MNKKGADKILSLYWFLILFLVAGVIVYMTGIFYSTSYDVRTIEGMTLGDQIANCIMNQSYLNDSVLTPEFKKNFMQDCHLNFSVENDYGWTNNSEYYVELSVYKYNPNYFNIHDPLPITDISAGNINIKNAWELNGLQQSQQSSSSLISKIKSTVSRQRKITTIVIHTTDDTTSANAANGAANWIEQEGLSIQYMIDRNGVTYSSSSPPAQYAKAFVSVNSIASQAGCEMTSPTFYLAQCPSSCETNGLLNPSCQNYILGGTALGSDQGKEVGTSVATSSPGCCIRGFNTYSVGIEVVSMGPQCTNYPNDPACKNAVSMDGQKWENFANYPQQMKALVDRVALLSLEYNIPVDRQHIVGHYQINTYKTDPGPNFPWTQFLKNVTSEKALLAAELSNSQNKNFPQGQTRSFYVVDKGGNQYIVQVLTIIRKTEKNV